MTKRVGQSVRSPVWYLTKYTNGHPATEEELRLDLRLRETVDNTTGEHPRVRNSISTGMGFVVFHGHLYLARIKYLGSHYVSSVRDKNEAKKVCSSVYNR